MSPRIIGSFENFLDLSLSRKNRLGWMLIWKTIVWTTWNLRNGVRFSEGTFFVERLIDSTFILEMVLDKNLGTSCSFYEWGTQPNFCWNQWSLVGWGVELSLLRYGWLGPLAYVLLRRWSLSPSLRGFESCVGRLEVFSFQMLACLWLCMCVFSRYSRMWSVLLIFFFLYYFHIFLI
jgi:hypothetical protein